MAGHNVLDAANQTSPRENMILPLADPAASGDERYRASSLGALISLASKAVIQSGAEAPTGSHVVPGRNAVYFQVAEGGSGFRFYFHDGASDSNWVEYVAAGGSASPGDGGGATTFLALTDTPAALGDNGTIVGVENGELAFVEPDASRALPAARIYQYSSTQDDVAHSALVVGTKTTKFVDWSATEIERDGGLGIQVASAVITFNGISNSEDAWAALNASPKVFVNDAVGDFVLRWSVADGTDPNTELDDYSYTLRNARAGNTVGETVFDMIAEETLVKLRGKVLEVGHIHRLEVSFTPTEVGVAPSWGLKDSQADDASGLWLRAFQTPVEPDASVYQGAWDDSTVYDIGDEVSHGGELWRKLLSGGNEEPVRGNIRVIAGAVAQAEIGSVLFAQDSDPNVIVFKHTIDERTNVGDLDPEELEAAENTAGGNAGFIAITGYSPVGSAGSVSFMMNGVHAQNYRYAFYLGNEQYLTSAAQFYNHGSATVWRFVLPARATTSAARPPWWSTTNRQLLKAETKAADTRDEVWERVTETADPELPDGGELGQVLKSTGESRQGEWSASGLLDALPSLPTPAHVGQVAVSGGKWWVVRHDSSEAVNAITYTIGQSPDDPHLFGFELGSFGRVTVNPHGLVRRFTLDNQSNAYIVEVLRSAVLDDAGAVRANIYSRHTKINAQGWVDSSLSRAANLDVAAHDGYIMYSGTLGQVALIRFATLFLVGESCGVELYSDFARKNKIGLNLASLVWDAMTSDDIAFPTYSAVADAPPAGDQAVGTTALIDGVLRTVVPADTIPQKGLHQVDLELAGSIFALDNSALGRAHVSHGRAQDNYDQFVGWMDWISDGASGGIFQIGLRDDIPNVALPANLIVRMKLYGDTSARTLTVAKQTGDSETIDGADYKLFTVATADYSSDHDYNGLARQVIKFYTAYTSETNNSPFDFKVRAPITAPSHWSQAGVKWESIKGDIKNPVSDVTAYLHEKSRGNYIQLTKDVREAKAVSVVLEVAFGDSYGSDVYRHFFTIDETPIIDPHEIHDQNNSYKGRYGTVVSPGGTGHSLGCGFTLDVNGINPNPTIPYFCLSELSGSGTAVVDILAIF